MKRKKLEGRRYCQKKQVKPRKKASCSPPEVGGFGEWASSRRKKEGDIGVTTREKVFIRVPR